MARLESAAIRGRDSGLKESPEHTSGRTNLKSS